MNLDDLRGRLSGVAGTWEKFVAKCPAHDDNRSSLSVGVGEEGHILVKCHAGCETPAVASALGLEMRDLMPKGNGHAGQPFTIRKTYDYQDEDGRLLYQVVRLEPKDFRVRRPDGAGGWIW